MALALIAKGHPGGPHAVPVIDGHPELGRAGPVPHLGQRLIGSGLDGGVNVRLGGHVRLGDEQGDAVLGLPALLGGPGGGQVAVGQAALAGQHFHGVVLIHSHLLLYMIFILSFVSFQRAWIFTQRSYWRLAFLTALVSSSLWARMAASRSMSFRVRRTVARFSINRHSC